MTDTLANCPRGHAATLHADEERERITISCVYCEGETVYRNCTVEQAVSEWNRRASPADLGGEELGEYPKDDLPLAEWLEAYANHIEQCLPLVDKLRKAVAALAASRPAVAVPDGWKLVPIEPTEEMIEAAYVGAWVYPKDIARHYRAILSAAPSPGGEGK